MPDETMTDGEVDAFMAKLNAVDFTDNERSLLRGIFEAAVPGEVEGFDRQSFTRFLSSLTPSQKEQVLNSMFPPGPKTGATPEGQKRP